MLNVANTILCAGIDVGDKNNGYHLVILKGKRVILSTRNLNPEPLVQHCLNHHVTIVAVEAVYDLFRRFPLTDQCLVFKPQDRTAARHQRTAILDLVANTA